jgi:hypothetical protein
MKIEILGTGCYNCIKLEKLISDILEELGKSDIELVRVSDQHRIRKLMPPDETPGLVIDGRLVSMREVPDRDTLKRWLVSVHKPDY